MVNKPAKVQRRRLDQAVVERGLAESRARAQALILARDVLVNGVAVSKAGAPVGPDDEIILKAPPRFVSRGGAKLDHALTAFDVDVSGKVAADFGASTGGFTDSLLQRGALRVYAIDVGYGQLAEKLRLDPRVVVMDRQNVRSVTELPEPVQIISIDVSFIGLRLVLPAARAVLAPDGEIVALVKPQFEAGRADVGKGGVVRDPAVHERVLREVIAAADTLGLGVHGVTASPLLGPAGNREFLVQLRPGAAGIDAEEATGAAVHAGVDGDP
ncbi:MAG: TlyA family RNA methyltransferase [Chloroflexota bacterium]|nr:TlyA family RNA methyltransferase [Chloroflexota bacterium]